jgi:hypothetical protein
MNEEVIDQSVTNTEGQVDETATVADDSEPETQDLSFDGNTVLTCVFTDRKKKGKDAREPICRPQFDLSKEQVDATWSKFRNMAKWIGYPNFLSTVIKEVFAPASLDASIEGFTPEGFNQIKYWEGFKSYFDPRERKKSGPTLKEISEQMAGLSQEILGFVDKLTKGEKLDEAEMNRLAQIKIQQLNLSEAKAKKERRGKAPKATPVKA